MDIPALYHSVILWIGDGTGLPDAILRIHAGLIILMLVRLVSGRSLGTLIPLLVVVLAELGNETLDYLNYGASLGRHAFGYRQHHILAPGHQPGREIASHGATRSDRAVRTRGSNPPVRSGGWTKVDAGSRIVRARCSVIDGNGSLEKRE